MKKNLYFTLMIAVMLVGIMLMTGCVPENLPDLVVANPQGWAGFCDIDDSGNLVVHIKNQGSAPAGSSQVKVIFGQYGGFVELVPALAVGETTTVLFPIPSGCFDPDCDFEITVDDTDSIDESNEMNNSQVGSCIG